MYFKDMKIFMYKNFPKNEAAYEEKNRYDILLSPQIKIKNKVLLQ